jgi:acetolactate synthase I/III small subunit
MPPTPHRRKTNRKVIMLHTFLAHVDNMPGALARIAFLFPRLNVNIASLTGVDKIKRKGVSA